MGDELKVGDVVEIKSGGAKMTVQEIDSYGGTNEKALCVWFEKNKRDEAVFEFAMLKKVEG